MKSMFLIIFLTYFANAKQVPPQATSAYGYLTNIGVPEAERIQSAEEEYLENPSRIVGGAPAQLGQSPWQAGLLIDLIGLDGTAVCGASLVSANRLVTAAHCWFDGQNQAWRYTVVLGSTQLFTGGNRIQTSVVVTHPKWFPLLVRNDIAVIYLSEPVSLSANIAPVSLPSADELKDLVGRTALASGFGINTDGSGISTNQSLSQVNLRVINNKICTIAFLGIVQESNLCTSGIGGVGPCGGDSGGPLVIQDNSRNVLVGIVSFGSALGCSIGLPTVFTRVTSYMDFINEHLQL